MLVGTGLRPLAYEHLVIFQETVGGHLEVERRRSLADPPGDVVVGTVAWAEPAAKVSRIWEWDAAQVGAHTNDNQPLRVLDTHRILLWITERCDVNTVGQLHIVFSPAPDENWLAPPLYSHSGTGLNA